MIRLDYNGPSSLDYLRVFKILKHFVQKKYSTQNQDFAEIFFFSSISYVCVHLLIGLTQFILDHIHNKRLHGTWKQAHSAYFFTIIPSFYLIHKMYECMQDPHLDACFEGGWRKEQRLWMKRKSSWFWSYSSFSCHDKRSHLEKLKRSNVVLLLWSQEFYFTHFYSSPN